MVRRQVKISEREARTTWPGSWLKDSEMVIAVTGGRNYQNAAVVNDTLDRIHKHTRITLLVHGNCPTGADQLAAQWAERNGVPHTGSKYSADWERYGGKAGPIRNRLMLARENPSYLVAFPGNNGTSDCCDAARDIAIRVLRRK